MADVQRLNAYQVDPGAYKAIATINVWNRIAVATHQALPEVSD